MEAKMDLEVGFGGAACGAAWRSAWPAASVAIAAAILRGAKVEELALHIEAGRWTVMPRAELARRLAPEKVAAVVRDRSMPGGLWISVRAGEERALFVHVPRGGFVLDHDLIGAVPLGSAVN